MLLHDSAATGNEDYTSTSQFSIPLSWAEIEHVWTGQKYYSPALLLKIKKNLANFVEMSLYHLYL